MRRAQTEGADFALVKTIREELIILKDREFIMLYWALIFLIVAIVAGLFGFRGVASAATGIAKVLFFLFIVIFIVLLVFSLLGGTPEPVVIVKP